MEGAGREAFDVFVSYTHADVEAVEVLQAALEAQGLRVFRDHDQIATFESISRRLEQGLARAKVLLAYYSERYPTRRPCQWELTNAFIAAEALGEANDRILVVNPVATVEHVAPVRLRDQLFPAGDPDAIAAHVARHVAAIDGPLGEQVVRTPPMHGRALLGSDRFTDRYATMWAIYEALHGDDVPIVAGRVASRPAVLCGQGGQGKSLVAEEYALRFGGLYPGGVLWLRALGDQIRGAATASDLAVQVAAYGALAAEVLPDETVAGLSADDLRSHLLAEIADRGPSLWVIDDLASGLDDAAFRAWLPIAPEAHVLITTRGRYDKGSRIDLEVLEGPDAVALLTAQVPPVGDGEEQAAAAVASMLGGHPLALDVAGTAIRYEGSTPYRTLQQRIQESETVVDVLEHTGVELPNGHQPSIIATIGGALDRLEGDGLTVLELASVLAADVPIPVELLRPQDAAVWGTDGATEIQARSRAGLVEVERHGLITRTDDGSWRIHRLVAQVLGHRHPERRPALRTALRTHLLDLLPLPADAAARRDAGSLVDHGRALLQHEDEAAVGPLAVWLGGYELRWGDPAHAVVLAEQGLVAAESTDDGTPASTERLLEAGATVVHVLRVAGRSDEACEIGERLAERGIAELGGDDLRVLRLQHHLAAALATAWRTEEGVPLQLHVAERFRELLGEDHPDTLWALSNHAIDLSEAGDLRGAAELAEQVLVDRVRVLGPEHPSTLTSMSNLACDWAELGRFTDAFELSEKVVAARDRILGPDHLETLQARANLANRYLDLGDVRSAHAIRVEVADARERLVGPDHPDTLAMRLSVAESLEDLGDPVGADEIAADVHRRRRERLGEDHPSTLISLADLGSRLRRRGRRVESRAIEEEVIERRARVLGPNDPATLTATMNLAVSMQDDGELDAAIARYREVLTTRLAGLGADHPDTLWVASNLAAALFEAGDLTQAEQLARSTLESRRRLIGPEHLETLRTANLLADILQQQGAREEAAELGLVVVAGRSARLGPTHPATMAARATTAQRLWDLDRGAEARHLREEQLALVVDRFGPESPEVLDALVGAALVLVDDDDVARARERAEAAFRLHGSSGDDRADLGHVIGVWNGVLSDLVGDHEAASRWLGDHLDALAAVRDADDSLVALGRRLHERLRGDPAGRALAPMPPAPPSPGSVPPPPPPPRTAPFVVEGVEVAPMARRGGLPVEPDRSPAIAAAGEGTGPLLEQVLWLERARVDGTLGRRRREVDQLVKAVTKQLGKRHPLALHVRFLAAEAEVAAGHPATAASEFKRVSRDAAKALGEADLLVGESLWRQAELEHDAGRDSLAIPPGERAVAALAAALGPEHPRVLGARAAVAAWRDGRPRR